MIAVIEAATDADADEIALLIPDGGTEDPVDHVVLNAPRSRARTALGRVGVTAALATVPSYVPMIAVAKALSSLCIVSEPSRRVCFVQPDGTTSIVEPTELAAYDPGSDVAASERTFGQSCSSAWPELSITAKQTVTATNRMVASTKALLSFAVAKDLDSLSTLRQIDSLRIRFENELATSLYCLRALEPRTTAMRDYTRRWERLIDLIEVSRNGWIERSDVIDLGVLHFVISHLLFASATTSVLNHETISQQLILFRAFEYLIYAVALMDRTVVPDSNRIVDARSFKMPQLSRIASAVCEAVRYPWNDAKRLIQVRNNSLIGHGFVGIPAAAYGPMVETYVGLRGQTIRHRARMRLGWDAALHGLDNWDSCRELFSCSASRIVEVVTSHNPSAPNDLTR